MRPLHHERIVAFHFTGKDGYWAPTANIMATCEADATELWPAIARQAAIVTAGAGPGRARAARIHDYVQSLWLGYGAVAHTDQEKRDYAVATPDEVIHFADNPHLPLRNQNRAGPPQEQTGQEDSCQPQCSGVISFG